MRETHELRALCHSAEALFAAFHEEESPDVNRTILARITEIADAIQATTEALYGSWNDREKLIFHLHAQRDAVHHITYNDNRLHGFLERPEEPLEHPRQHKEAELRVQELILATYDLLRAIEQSHNLTELPPISDESLDWEHRFHGQHA